jgi:hypothetical protein
VNTNLAAGTVSVQIKTITKISAHNENIYTINSYNSGKCCYNDAVNAAVGLVIYPGTTGPEVYYLHVNDHCAFYAN